MPTEHASVRVVHKPWGVSDLQPWSSFDGTSDPVGELWFERADENAPIPTLLLKLLFTSEPLSIGGARTSIEVGVNGLTALVAYPATAPIGSLLQRLGEPSSDPVPQGITPASQMTALGQART